MQTSEKKYLWYVLCNCVDWKKKIHF